MKEVFIVSAVRTPIGSFGGNLLSLTAVELGSKAIKGAIDHIDLDPKEVEEVFMGNVVSANLGQAPARQAAIGAGIGYEVPCTTVNKVCASGMKSIMLASQAIMLGLSDTIIAGGMESMSNIPFYVPKARFGYKYGNAKFIDGLVKDGLEEAYHHFPMGNCADNTAKEMKISRQEQDDYAIRSYKRTAQATESGKFKEEIVAIEIPQRKGDPLMITEDEEFRKVSFDKIPFLKPVFSKEGTVTAANSSTINDGASALVIMSEEKMKSLNLKPLAKIHGFADAARDPIWFTTAPTLAIPKALKNARMEAKDVDYYEINEAFSVVALANARNLDLDMDKLNVNGGAVALGHPLGASGARIVTTLTNVLDQQKASIGVAGICNGGGGASAIVIERL